MSRARRVFTAFGIGLGNQVLAALLGLWVTRFSLHRIGSHDYGLWLVAGQVFAYLALLDLGVMGLLAREISLILGKPIDQSEREAELRALLERSLSLVLLVVPILLAGALGVLAWLPPEWAVLRWPLTVALGLYVAIYPFRMVTVVLTGLQELAYLAWLQTASWIATAVTTVVLILLGFRLYALAVATAVAPTVAAIAGLARLLTRHRAIFPRRVRLASRAVVRAHLPPGIWVSLTAVAHVLLNATDIVVIGRILGPDSVLKFSFTDKTENLLNTQPFQVGNLAAPGMAELKGTGRKGELIRMIGVLTASTLILSGAVVLAILETNHAFVRTWIGDQYFGGTALTVTILANMMARHWQFSHTIAIFNYSGGYRETTFMALADGVVSVVLSVVLVHRIGVVGAPLGSLLSVLLTQWPAGVILNARESGTPPWASFAPVMPWLVRFVPLAVVAGAAGNWLGHSSLFVVSAVGAVIGAAYVAVMLPLLRRPPLDVYAAPYLAKLPFLRKAGG